MIFEWLSLLTIVQLALFLHRYRSALYVSKQMKLNYTSVTKADRGNYIRTRNIQMSIIQNMTSSSSLLFRRQMFSGRGGRRGFRAFSVWTKQHMAGWDEVNSWLLWGNTWTDGSRSNDCLLVDGMKYSWNVGNILRHMPIFGVWKYLLVTNSTGVNLN